MNYSPEMAQFRDSPIDKWPDINKSTIIIDQNLKCAIRWSSESVKFNRVPCAVACLLALAFSALLFHIYNEKLLLDVLVRYSQGIFAHIWCLNVFIVCELRTSSKSKLSNSVSVAV